MTTFLPSLNLSRAIHTYLLASPAAVLNRHLARIRVGWDEAEKGAYGPAEGRTDYYRVFSLRLTRIPSIAAGGICYQIRPYV